VATARRSREHPPVGERLRAERHRRGLSLRDLAGRLGVSPSLISQIETGRARPSVSTLYAIATELNVSIDDLLFQETDGIEARGASGSEGEPGPATRSAASGGPVQRAHDRLRIRLASGVRWERLTTTSDPGHEFLLVTYEVGGASSPLHEFQRHAGREWGYVLKGTLGVTIAFDDYELGPGDSVTLDSTVPHRLYNRGSTPVHAVWFVAGRLGADAGEPSHREMPHAGPESTEPPTE
jgi:transcriptional regulator with XRE-family HTH domain